MIEVKNLCKEFKLRKKYEGLGGTFKSFFSNQYTIKQAVNDISFHINKGEMVGYIGLNGAGKSTTIKMLTGLMTPTSGECIINGIVPYKNRVEHTKNIGVVFGNRSQLWWDLPVSESFYVLKEIYKVPNDIFKKRLDFLCDVLDIKDFYLTPVRNLSLGQKMRADLIASLLHSPQVLFLDEPTIGLDILVKDKIRKALKDINAESQTTVMLTTHDLDDIEEICSKIILIDEGRIIFNGDLSELMDKYGKTRGISIDLQADVDLNFDNVPNINPQHLNQKINFDGKITILFEKDYISLPILTSYLVNTYPVRDFTILEPKLEEIIKQIYRTKKVDNSKEILNVHP